MQCIYHVTLAWISRALTEISNCVVWVIVWDRCHFAVTILVHSINKGSDYISLWWLYSQDLSVFVMCVNGTVARSDARPPCMRMVSGSIIESGPAIFFRWDWSWNHFYGHPLPTAESSRAVASYWRKDVYFVLVNRSGSLPRNSVVRLTDRLDMTIAVDWDVKPQIKQTAYGWKILQLS